MTTDRELTPAHVRPLLDRCRTHSVDLQGTHVWFQLLPDIEGRTGCPVIAQLRHIFARLRSSRTLAGCRYRLPLLTFCWRCMRFYLVCIASFDAWPPSIVSLSARDKRRHWPPLSSNVCAKAVAIVRGLIRTVFDGSCICLNRLLIFPLVDVEVPKRVVRLCARALYRLH